MGVRNRVAKKKPGVKIPTIKSAAQIALEATKHKPQNRIQPGTQLKLQPSMGSKKRLVSQIAGGTQSKAVDTKRTKMSLSGNVVSGVEKTDIASVKKAVNGDVKTTSPENTTVQTKVVEIMTNRDKKKKNKKKKSRKDKEGDSKIDTTTKACTTPKEEIVVQPETTAGGDTKSETSSIATKMSKDGDNTSQSTTEVTRKSKESTTNAEIQTETDTTERTTEISKKEHAIPSKVTSKANKKKAQHAPTKQHVSKHMHQQSKACVDHPVSTETATQSSTKKTKAKHIKRTDHTPVVAVDTKTAAAQSALRHLTDMTLLKGSEALEYDTKDIARVGSTSINRAFSLNICACCCSDEVAPIPCKYADVGCSHTSSSKAIAEAHEMVSMALHLDMAMRTVTDLRSGKRSDKSDKSDNAKPLPLSGYSAHEPIHRPIQLDNSDDSSNDEDECSACHEEGELFRCGGCRKRFHEMCDPLPPDVSMSQLLRRKKRRCGYCEATKPREQPDKDLSDRDTVHDLMDDSDDESSNDDDLDGNLEGFIVTSDSEVSDGERGDYNKASVKPVSDSDVGESDFDPESDHTVATNNDVRVNGSKRRITRGYSSGSHGNGGISVVEIQHSDIDSDHSVVNLHNTRTKKMRQIESELESDAESIPSDAELDMVVVDEGKNGSDRDGNVANHDSDDVVDDGNHSNLNVVSIAHEGDHSDQNSNHSDQDSESDDNEIEKHAIENMSDSEAQDSGEDSDDQMM